MSLPRQETTRRAFELMGRRLKLASTVDLVIAGGGAAMLLGIRQPGRATEDIDAIFIEPSKDEEEILRMAGEVGRELDLDVDWLNVHSKLYFHEMPQGWRDRLVPLGIFGRLKVLLLSRGDFIAMKFYAHRAEDIQDLQELPMAVTDDEMRFSEAYLLQMARDSIGEPGKIEMALHLLHGANWLGRNK